MNQLQLNLELIDSEQQEYRGFLIVVYKSIPVKTIDRYESIKNSCGKFRQQFMQTLERLSYWETVIYKKSSKHSGKKICRYLSKADAVLKTQSWIDIHEFGEREKHKWYKR